MLDTGTLASATRKSASAGCFMASFLLILHVLHGVFRRCASQRVATLNGSVQPKTFVKVFDKLPALRYSLERIELMGIAFLSL
jgi:hypothetical protein